MTALALIVKQITEIVSQHKHKKKDCKIQLILISQLTHYSILLRSHNSSQNSLQ